MAVVVMRPGGEHEQTAFGAGIELFTMGLRERGETIFQDDDGGELSVEGGTHDAFLARRNGRGNKDGARLCSSHITAYFVLKLCFIVAPRNADCKAVRSVEKGEVANPVVGVRAYVEVEERAEVFRMGALHEQAAGVVLDVVDEGGEHIVALADKVVVVRLEEEAVVAILAALAPCFLLTLLT